MSRKLNIGKFILGILLILSIVLLWILAVSLMKWNSGGGLVLMLPLFFIIKAIWKDMVIQKASIVDNSKNLINSGNQNNQFLENLETDKRTTLVNIDNDLSIRNSSNVIKSSFNWFFSLVFFKLNYHKLMFSEGTRRLIVFLSILIPILSGLLYEKAKYSDYYDSSNNNFIVGLISSYFIFHIFVLVYKWIFDGYNK